MGQNSSFHLGITDVIREWAPISKDSPIFINRSTRCHLQRFIVQIPLPELLRQVTIYNARIQAVHPYVCKIAYFNQVPSQDQSKAFRNFAVYADHLMPIREDDWTLPRFAQALEAVLTLVGYYGFFRLTEAMMLANERGETKVWISHSPVHNHRDFVFTTEAQALFSITEIATRRNQEVASVLMNCTTLGEAMERLNKMQRTFAFPCEALSHQAQQPRESRKDYKNVFQQESKIDYINNQSKLRLPNSALFSHHKKEEFKPFSYGGNNQSALSGRTTSHYKKGKPTGSQFFLKKRPESKNIGETSFDNFAKLPKQQRLFEAVPHFQTTAQFSTKYQIASPSSKQAKPLLFTPDITIINNNVSHVVNNITHNHSAWAYQRNPKTPQFLEQAKNEPASQLKSRGKTDKVSAPKFIQQRKQERTTKHNIKSFYTNSSEKSSGIINAPKSFLRDPPSSANSSNNANTQQSFKSAEAEWSKEPATRKPQKLYTFCRPMNGKSPPKPFSSSFSPQGHTPFTPPANLHNTSTSNTSFFKKPSRTLTTQFNGPPTASFIAANNKSFNIERHQKDQLLHYESPKNSKIMKETTAMSQAIPEDAAEALPTSKSIPFNATSGKSIEGNLKQQLKLEFSSLMGTEPKIAHKAESGKQTPPESSLKEKIQQKKIAFAELKKQALAVLTDML